VAEATGDRPNGVDPSSLAPWSTPAQWATLPFVRRLPSAFRLSPAAAAAAALVSVGCAAGPLALSAPNVAPSQARDPTPVQLEPIATGAGVTGDFAPPGPAAVLTAAMSAELAGRALRGGEPGGYGVRCTLDRFALRTRSSVADGEEMMALYADLSCEATA
jgi:hypothetical protein